MKKIFLLLTGFLPFLIFAQTASISGTVDGSPATKISMVDDPMLLGIGADEQVSELKGGKFKFSVKINEPRMVELKLGQGTRKIYLEAGDDLKLEIGNDITGFIVFSGKGSSSNIALQELSQRFRADFTDSLLRQEMLQKSIDIFEMERFEKLQLHKEFVSNHPDKGAWSAEFKDFLESHVRYNYLAALMGYPIENANASSITRVVPLPQIMLDPVTDERINHPSSLIDARYRAFLNYYVTYEGSRLNEYAKFTEITKSLEKKYDAAKAKLSGTPFLWYMTDYVLKNGEKCRPGAVRRIQKGIAEVSGGAAYAALIENKLGDHLALSDDAFASNSSTARANAVPDDLWVLYDQEGNKVTLKDFRGKVVYIDFWASWCGPCRQQFPYAKTLHERFNKKELKDLVFLYISLDKTEADWRKGLEQNQMEGFQTHSPANFNSDLAAHYRINSIPRYMLVNKKGEVVDGNAKRPGMEGIYDDLIKLLSE